MTERPPATAPARRRYRRLLTPALAATGVAVAAAFVAAGLNARANAPTATSAPENYGRAPTYQLTDQNGQTVSSRQFTGKVQVVSFLFPYCTSYCPLIARDLARLAATVATGPLRGKVQLVSFNVDPAGAGPPVLRRFISQYGGHPSDPGWEYLTGTPRHIRQVVTGGFHVYFNKVSLRYENHQVDQQKRQALHDALTHRHPTPYTPPRRERNQLAVDKHVRYDVVHNDFVEIISPDGSIVAVFDRASSLTLQQLLTAVEDASHGRPIPLQPS